MPFFLGNDVVALASPRCRGRTGDIRFLNRVFSPRERGAIEESSSPEAALWLHWASKEAVFKSVTKALGHAPVFHHERFRISFPQDLLATLHAPSAHRTAEGTAGFEAYAFRLRATLAEDFLHAVAWMPDPSGAPPTPPTIMAEVRAREEGWTGRKEALRPSFSDPEWGCVSHIASAFTRLGAREALASALSVDGGRVEIRCGPGSPGRRVPLVYLDGKEIPADLTLSHDAHLMAWAFLAPNEEGSFPGGR